MSFTPGGVGELKGLLKVQVMEVHFFVGLATLYLHVPI